MLPAWQVCVRGLLPLGLPLPQGRARGDKNRLEGFFFFSGLTTPSPVAGARRGLRGAGALAFRTQTQGRHFAPPPTPCPAPLSPSARAREAGRCARVRVPPYIRVGAGGAGGAALQTEKVGVEAMARPLILGLLSLLGLLATGKRCPPPSELLPHQLSPGGLEERFSERPACSGRGQRGGGEGRS